MNIWSVFNEYVVMSLVALVLLAVFVIIKKRLRSKDDGSAKKATGIILALEKIALAKEHHVEIKILVMVMPERSRNFVGELVETVLLTDLLLMKIGDRIAVEYYNNCKLMLSRPAA